MKKKGLSEQLGGFERGGNTGTHERKTTLQFRVSHFMFLVSRYYYLYLYSYYQSLQPSILQSTYKDYINVQVFLKQQGKANVTSYTCLHFNGFFSKIFFSYFKH